MELQPITGVVGRERWKMFSFLPCLLHQASSSDGFDLGDLFQGFYPTGGGNVTELCSNHTGALFDELNRIDGISEWAIKRSKWDVPKIIHCYLGSYTDEFREMFNFATFERLNLAIETFTLYE
ncbi:unnamed protein product [Darwinula stevensoni]|uniref:Uncharacterized protein n=1 Tax=Darwinula stevensoni TaxID=69355 RepID=A0A7R9A7X0_9CRUS|nr:unnamed protein product [Darwinula stevensoni]CAG0893871.1 unnamed protein product [Darwinula stevensoni]